MVAGATYQRVTSMDIRRSPDPKTVAAELAAYLLKRVAQVIEDRGVCNLALAGGNTPKAAYELMRSMPFDWQHLHIWYGDERCLPVGDAQRNDSMVRKALLDGLPISQAQLHSIAAELGPQKAASQYSEALSRIERLDIVLLGLGEDGHTASLFPSNAALTLSDNAVAVYHAPKPPPERVSLSMNCIRQAGERIILAAGEGKHEALSRITAGEMLPAAIIGEAIWFVDEAAIAGVCTDASMHK